MAIFGNFKGTTVSDFKIGKSSGNKISTGTRPSSDESLGDIFIDSSNASLQVYNNAWLSVGETLTNLNVDNGTLYVDSSNDTVSIGSTSSNEKLFVNGSLRLGTNPSVKYSGAYLDLQHSNGTGSVIRIRDNNTGTDPIFKVYNANNTAEVFKVQGSNVTVNNAYTLPTSDGSANQVLTTDGSGNLTFATVATDLVNDTTPELGGNLDAKGYTINTVENIVLGNVTSSSAYTNFSNVVLGLPFNGTNGATTTSDVSNDANGAATFSGQAALSTSQYKFGTASLALDGSGDYISYSNTTLSALNFTTSDDFTYETFAYAGSAQGGGAYGGVLFGSAGASNGWVVRQISNTKLELVYPGVAAYTWTVTIPLNQWNHIAFIKDGTNYYLALNGSVNTMHTGHVRAIDLSYDSGLYIGGEPNAGGYYNGYLDDFVVTSGVAKYTSSYSVPTVSVSSSSGTTTVNAATLTFSGNTTTSDITIKRYESGNLTSYSLIDSISNKIENVVEDTTPQLGGNLDAQSYNITGVGSLTVANVTYPTSDGSANQVLTTDGSGTLSFTTISVNPDGSNTQVQFNNAGSFGASTGFTFDDANDTLQTGVVRGIAFERITDYGSIDDSANIAVDMGTVDQSLVTTENYEFLYDTFGPTGENYTVSTVPSATQPGQMIFVSDETGGPTMAFSDGTNWRRIQDRAVVS